ncbi:MAG: Rv1355c family protein, partial [Bacteroidota bacterium]|nr:Rv1355c family protein [Bacteroidota bacterium]MDX5430939.1 Rv1355c family protein [Bacteroidota bacterium]MDX5469687.1 Rv1355c family protein [Bacteroidota bacterium]
MERGFGEIRLADFDLLELTNLNRIRTGVHNLGLPKVISVAREIMEIDPFLKVVPFLDGLTQENMDAFFTAGGNLDLLIDECDGLDIKILARYKARELQIPVLMEASDRATVDVERFDLEPERPLLHGLVKDLDPQKLSTLKTNEDKVPYMLAIVGLDTISTRAKASMVEIGETISTWPQLASAVTLGGGITADVARRIFLNQYKSSGRYHIDLDELIGDQVSDFTVPDYTYPEPGEIAQDKLDWCQANASRNTALSPESVKNILDAAHAAPSGGNLQPWEWIHCGSSFFLFRKNHLTSSFLDHNLMATWVSLGASIENALLAIQKEGFHAEWTRFPAGDLELIARIDLENLKSPNDYESNNARLKLFDHIHDRHTNRNIEVSAPVETEQLEFITQSLEPFDVSIRYFNQGEEKDLLSNCIAAVERIRLLDPEGYRNFMEEVRWTPQQAKAQGDGVDLATCDLTPSEVAGFRIARHRPVMDLIQQWELGSGLEKLSHKMTDHAPVLAMIHGPERGRDAYLQAGRALERAWIAANQVGLGFQPQSPFTLLIDRIIENKGLNLRDKNELAAYREKIMALTSVNHPEPLFIFRLFKGEKPVVRSYRRPMHYHTYSLG